MTALLGMLMAGAVLSAQGGEQPIRCVVDSPERHGAPGCSIVEHRPLQSRLPVPLLWHIDEFDSEAAARRAAGPLAVAFTAHGRAWLATLEPDASDHHGGTHRAIVGPLPLAADRAYSMMVMSAYFLPGQVTTIHRHSGPEALYVVEGIQCLETTTSGIAAHAGEVAVVPAGETMRMVAMGEGPRRALVLILHDAEQPATTVLDASPQLRTCR